MSPVSALGIPGYILFWGLFVVASALFAQRLYFLYRLMRLGKPENRFDRMGQRIRMTLFEIIPQWCSLKTTTRQDRSGIAHALLFWGFSLYLISYVIFIGLAGGFGPFANTKSVEILRSGGPGKAGKKIIVSVKAIEDGKHEDMRLEPNDVINVPRRIF